MCIRFNDYCRPVGRRVLAALVAVSIGATAWLPVRAAAEEPAADAMAEDSVLVATREATENQRATIAASSDSEEGILEPISQIAEHTPELAETALAEDERPDRFADALAGAATQRPKINAQPAKFNSIQPGVSTKDDVLAAWKEPASSKSTAGGSVLTYEIEPFQSVEVEVKDNLVVAINIELDSSLSPKRLAKQLSLDSFDAVVVTDAQGETLGQAYPERGVLFMYAPAADVVAATTNPLPPAVTHVVIQPLDADAFALRAESRLHGPYEKNIQDLTTALALKPELAYAHWLLAEIYLSCGQAEQAISAIDDTCELEPENAAYQLRRAQVMSVIGRYDDATLAVRSVLDRETTPPLVKAQALHEMARLAALGEAEIAAKAIAFDNRAIALADSLATSKNVKERRAAKRLLIDAHLSIARQIAANDFNNKLDSVSQWIGRASGLAEDFIANDGGSIELRLVVAKESLASLASIRPTRDPGPWISEAEQTVATLSQLWDDDLWRRHLQWELGQAYFQGVRIEHLRQQPAAALRYGQLAIENLADGAAKRQAVYDSEQLVGELYFHIGVVHAVQKQDHKTAAQWYDKALPLLAVPRPASELLAPQHDGEAYVSMGVTYWQIGEKDHAIDLTLNGAQLVEQAVESGVLPKKALAVPYGNLASMYEQLGSSEDAAKYSGLAKAANGSIALPVNTRPTNRPATSTATTVGQNRGIAVGQHRPNPHTATISSQRPAPSQRTANAQSQRRPSASPQTGRPMRRTDAPRPY